MTLAVTLANVANTLVVSPGPSTNKIYVDANGQVGFGASPSTGWASQTVAKAIDITGNTYAFVNLNSSTGGNLSHNAYWDGTSWRYKSTGPAAAIGFNSGSLFFYGAVSGPAGNTINFNTGMGIDTSGRVTTPNRPVFHVTAGVAVANTGGQTVTYSSTIFDIGSNVNLGNGRFTAPVTGTYFFEYHQLTPAASGFAGEFRAAIYKNGAGYGGLRWITYKSTASTFQYIFAQGHVYMTAGDYVTVVFESGATALYTDANYGAFTGHLVG